MPQARASVVRTEYVPEFGRVVRIREFDRPMLSDDDETGQTIAYMDDLATAASKEPAIADATDEALDWAGLQRGSDPLDVTHAIYWWLKRTIRYVPTPGTSPFVDQTLIDPCAILAMPEPIGDCPQFSMLANAMLRVCCINSLFVTIKAEEKEPDLWSHVYNTVEVYPDVWLPFDSSNGPEPGAEYARPFAKRIWPRLNAASCGAKERKAMVHSHRRTVGMRNRNLRGALGDTTCDQDGNCYDTETGVYNPAPISSGGDLMTGPNPTPAELNQPLYPLSPTPAPSSGPSLLSTLLSDATQLTAPIIKAATTPAPYFITSPTGQSVLYNPATGQTAAPGISSIFSSSNAGGLSGSAIVIGLVVIGAVLLGSKK